MKKLFISFVIASSLCYTGCATLFSGSSDEVSLSSDPKGANVYVNGDNRGKTPITLSLKKGKEYSIEFEKDGYEKKTWHLSYSLGAGWLILDVLAGLVGIIVDASTGAWNEFNDDSYKARLEKIESNK